MCPLGIIFGRFEQIILGSIKDIKAFGMWVMFACAGKNMFDRATA